VKSFLGFFIFSFLVLVFITGTLSAGDKQSNFETLQPGDHYRLEKIPELKEIIEQNRKIKYYPKEKVGEIVKPFLYNFDEFEEVDPKTIPKTELPGFDLSKNEIIEDIEFLFKVLKYGYAGYEIQGGDPAFFEAEERIINSVEELAGKKDDVAFSHGNFKDILIEELSFVNDWHFKIGQERFYSPEKMHLAPELDFNLSQEGFYREKDGEKTYLISCNGKDPEKFLYPSLNLKGELVYRLVKRVRKGDQEKITLILEQKGERLKKEISLKPGHSPDYHRIPFDTHEENGIPVITNRDLSRYYHDDLKSMIEKAGELRDEDLFILDLRGNTGGSTEYVRGWVRELSSKPDYEYWGWGAIDLRTQTSHRIKKNTELFLGFDGEWVDERFYPTDKGWSEVYYREPRRIENDVLIFVLIDEKIASAGEAFVLALREMENVVFVGSNTAGGFNIGNYSFFNLPNSGVFFQIGVSLFFPPDLSVIEGKGLAPDIWVAPSTALDKTLAFIERYLR